MKIGFFHRDTYPLTEGSSVQSWQLVRRLQSQGHTLVSVNSPFPGVKNFPRKTPPWVVANAVDAFVIIIDGQFNFAVEKFSAYSIFTRKKIPVIWLINAPIQESLVLPWYQKHWYLWDQLLRKLASFFVTSAIAVSEEVQKYAENTLGLKTQIIVNGTDPQHFKPKKNNPNTVLHKLSSYYKVVWAGNGIFPWQGIDQIIAIAKKIKTIDPKIVFILITDQVWMKLPALNNLFILPAATYQDLPDYLAEADVCLSLYNPNYQNVFYNSPMKLFDAMAMAKPIIASNLGQIAHVIGHKKNGLLVKNKNEAIKSLLFLKSHPALAKKIGMQARKDVESHYNWERFGTEVETVITDALKHP